MTGLGLGLAFGTGLLCIWWACWPLPGPRARRRSSRLADDLRQAGLPGVGAGHIRLACVACGIVVLVAAMAITRSLPIAACFGAIAGATPVSAMRARARRRRAQLRDLWPDAVDNLTSAVRAGLSLPEALGQLAIRGPVELRGHFEAFALDYRAGGRFHDALDLLKVRLADPVGDRIVESLRMARDVGGADLGRLLRTLSEFLRQDARTRSELEARQGWTVNAARLAVASPWVVLMLLATRPESVAAYNRPTGIVVLVGGGAVSLASYALMRRIARLPEERRVLR